jgi:cbb3-type cytochrome oxidase subunit 3
MQGKIGKKRSPFAVWGLTVITLGIYGLVWWYKANRETHDFDNGIQVNPGLAVLALFGFYIGAFITVFNTGKRISRAQAAAGLPASCNGGLGILFMFLLGTHSAYYQSELNKIWDSYQGAPEGALVPHRAVGVPAYAG